MASDRIEQRSEVRDGMHIDFDVPITASDGLVLRADVYRPTVTGDFPAIVSYGPYAKGLAFQDGYAPQWTKMLEDFPEIATATSNRYQNWEVVDPERWVPDGYACVRVDSRGTGHSPGYLDLWSAREAQDLYDCIEWVATQDWSNGKVGLSGISYYAMNQYQVAARNPPHLVAIIPWEGSNDWYRELSHHGGILCDFGGKWYPRQVSTVQFGVGERGGKSRLTGDLVAGPPTLGEEELAANRADFARDIKSRPLWDEWYSERATDWSRVTIPMLSAGNWGGQNLHLRGNVEAFVHAASDEKWLELHGNAHWGHFYSDYGVALQKRFFAHYLKGEDNGWEVTPRVIVNVRHIPERYVVRTADAWPLPNTQWTTLHFDPAGMRLSPTPPIAPTEIEYDPMGPGLTFTTAPLQKPLEVTGPMVARVSVAGSSTDVDLFLVVRVFDPDGSEVTFQGAVDPNTPISQGWLRLSHRKVDPERSLPYRPWRPHDELLPVVPGEVYTTDVEIWPSCVVVPAGYRLAVTVKGSDYVYEGELSEFAKSFYYAHRGVGPYTHSDPDDRPPAVFDQPVTLHLGGRTEGWILLPVIPGNGVS